MFLIMCIRILCLNSGVKDLFPKSSTIFEFCIYILYFEVIFLWGFDEGFLFIYFLVYGYSVVSIPLVEKMTISPLNCLYFFVKNELILFVWVYFCTLCSRDWLNIFCEGPHGKYFMICWLCSVCLTSLNRPNRLKM